MTMVRSPQLHLKNKNSSHESEIVIRTAQTMRYAAWPLATISLLCKEHHNIIFSDTWHIQIKGQAPNSEYSDTSYM
jgi:hypothetical protein